MNTECEKCGLLHDSEDGECEGCKLVEENKLLKAGIRIEMRNRCNCEMYKDETCTLCKDCSLLQLLKKVGEK